MKKYKKLLSVLACVVMVFTVLSIKSGISASAYTSGYYTYTVSNGEATITGCSTSISKNVTIPSTLGGYPVTKIGPEAFFCTSITSVVIPNSVRSIGISAFELSDLKNITIPNSVTNIGDCAFVGTLLTNITIPDSVTNIGTGIFWNCGTLKRMTVPFLGSTTNDTKNACLGYFFGVKYSEQGTEIPKSLEEIIITKSKQIGEYGFYNCDSIESITIPKSVSSIGKYAFFNCVSIENLYFNGTDEEWNKIQIKTTGNEAVLNADIYYNSNGGLGKINSVSIHKLPTKLNYFEKTENLDLSGGVLSVNYESGAYQLIDLTDLTVSGFDNTKLGKQTITVKYGDYSVTFGVSIAKNTPAPESETSSTQKNTNSSAENPDNTNSQPTQENTDGTIEPENTATESDTTTTGQKEEKTEDTGNNIPIFVIIGAAVILAAGIVTAAVIIKKK